MSYEAIRASGYCVPENVNISSGFFKLFFWNMA